MKRFIYILIGSVLCSGWVSAQNGSVLYGLHCSIPQASAMNPAFVPEKKLNIGIPFLSHEYVGLSNRFSINDLIIKDASDSLQVDPDALLASLHRNNAMSVISVSGLFYAGIHIMGGYLFVSGDLITETRFSYTKDFFNLLIHGNGSADILGRKINLHRLDFNATVYSKTGAGFAFPLLDEKLTLGVKLNYLKGYLNAEVDRRFEGYFRTDPEDFNLEVSLSDAQFNTAGLGLFDDNTSINRHFFGFSNNGVSIDAGAVYKIDGKSETFISLTDMGFIDWNYDVKKYRINNGLYNYSGIDIEDVDNVDTMLDSLKDIFNPVELAGSYKSYLAAHLSAGYSYRLNTKHTLDILFNGLRFRENFQFGIGLGYTLQVSDWFRGRLTYTYLNNKPINIGLGTVIKAGPVSLFVLSDNFIFLLHPAGASFAEVNAGVNLVF